MKKIIKTFIFFLTTLTLAHAQNPPLRVAVNRFVPPYVMQGGNKQLFGFDIVMMDFICKRIQRDCSYQLMNFGDVLPSVIDKKTDVGIGAIAITAERANQVLFSTPYLPSESRFLGRTDLKEKFTLSLLKNKAIGVEAGTVFRDIITQLRIETPKTVIFNHEEEMVEALVNDKVDFVLLDAPTALFWQNHSSGMLKAVGIPMPYGFGLGIAVNQNETALLQAINQALLDYQKSRDFIKNYRMYLEQF